MVHSTHVVTHGLGWRYHPPTVEGCSALSAAWDFSDWVKAPRSGCGIVKYPTEAGIFSLSPTSERAGCGCTPSSRWLHAHHKVNKTLEDFFLSNRGLATGPMDARPRHMQVSVGIGAVGSICLDVGGRRDRAVKLEIPISSLDVAGSHARQMLHRCCGGSIRRMLQKTVEWGACVGWRCHHLH